MWDTCKDLCGIHAGYMYLQRFQDTYRIHELVKAAIEYLA
jgi:hypothetical protein